MCGLRPGQPNQRLYAAKRALFCLVAVVCAGCATGELDAREAANALANEFEDWLSFEDGTVEDGEPPGDNPDDPVNHPRIDTVDAPITIVTQDDPAVLYDRAYGETFDVVLDVDDASDVNRVSAVAVWVTQANKDDRAGRWIRIPLVNPIDPITLRATVTRTPSLPGNSFQVRFALLNDANEAGNYAQWYVITQPAGGEETRVPMCSCDGQTGQASFLDEPGCRAAGTAGETIADLGGCDAWRLALASHTPVGQEPPADLAYPSGTRVHPADPGEACMLELRCHQTSTADLGGLRDDRATADRLADRLSDVMRFDDNRRVPGGPPVEHADSSLGAIYPQIEMLELTDGFDLPPGDEPPEVVVQILVTRASYSTADVCGAVVQVFQANAPSVASSHFRLGEQGLQGGNTLTGHVGSRAGLEGNAFGLRVALLNHAGEAGNYRWVYLHALPSSSHPGKVPSCAPSSSPASGGRVELLDGCAQEAVLSMATDDPVAAWFDFFVRANGNSGLPYDFSTRAMPSGTQVQVPGTSAHTSSSDGKTYFYPATGPCTLQLVCP